LEIELVKNKKKYYELELKIELGILNMYMEDNINPKTKNKNQEDSLEINNIENEKKNEKLILDNFISKYDDNSSPYDKIVLIKTIKSHIRAKNLQIV
jgi:hypothetical protein